MMSYVHEKSQNFAFKHMYFKNCILTMEIKKDLFQEVLHHECRLMIEEPQNLMKNEENDDADQNIDGQVKERSFIL